MDDVLCFSYNIGAGWVHPATAAVNQGFVGQVKSFYPAINDSGEITILWVEQGASGDLLYMTHYR